MPGSQEEIKHCAFRNNNPPPPVTFPPPPASLWPPNGQMFPAIRVPVTISGTTTDDTSGVNTTSVTFAVTDEYGTVHPSGPVTLAASGNYSFKISLQASRRGTDLDGRLYTIT